MTVLGAHERSRLGAFHRSPLGARGRPTVYLDLGRAVQSPANWSFDGKSYVFSHWSREITLTHYICGGTTPTSFTDADGVLLEWKRTDGSWDEDPSEEEAPYPALFEYDVPPSLPPKITSRGAEYGQGSEMTGDGRFFIGFLSYWGSPKVAVPTCGSGWAPNDPADDDVTEVVDLTATGAVSEGYELLERPDTESAWVSASSGDGFELWNDSYRPTLQGEAEKAWALKTTPFDEFRVWPIREDPQAATITTVTVPAIIWAWIFDEDRTLVQGNDGKVYVYDADASLVETLNPAGSGVDNYAARSGCLYFRRTSTAKMHVYRWDGESYVEEAELDDPGFTLAVRAGVALAAGGSQKIVRGLDGTWSVVPYSRGTELLLDGWNWYGTTFNESVLWKGERLAFAPI